MVRPVEAELLPFTRRSRRRDRVKGLTNAEGRQQGRQWQVQWTQRKEAQRERRRGRGGVGQSSGPEARTKKWRGAKHPTAPNLVERGLDGVVFSVFPSLAVVFFRPVASIPLTRARARLLPASPGIPHFPLLCTRADLPPSSTLSLVCTLTGIVCKSGTWVKLHSSASLLAALSKTVFASGLCRHVCSPVQDGNPSWTSWNVA